jgi:primosomal protein N' (replication factor Y)
VRCSGPAEPEVRARLEALATALRAALAKGAAPDLEVLGPAPSPLTRINRRVRWQLLLRSRQRTQLRGALRWLRPHLGAGAGETTAVVDVDPYSFL